MGKNENAFIKTKLNKKNKKPKKLKRRRVKKVAKQNKQTVDEFMIQATEQITNVVGDLKTIACEFGIKICVDESCAVCDETMISMGTAGDDVCVGLCGCVRSLHEKDAAAFNFLLQIVLRVHQLAAARTSGDSGSLSEETKCQQM